MRTMAKTTKIKAKPQKVSGPILSPEARIVEVILFLENEPVDRSRLKEMTKLNDEELDDAVTELSEHYSLYMHGLTVNENPGGFLITPAGDLYSRLRSLYGKKVERRLTKATLETLSIIAYSQPITRREIDKIRGVSSDTIIKLLREREYIKVVGRKDVIGHPCLYGTTRKFLYEFHLQSISDLPKLDELDEERFADTDKESREEEKEKKPENGKQKKGKKTGEAAPEAAGEAASSEEKNESQADAAAGNDAGSGGTPAGEEAAPEEGQVPNEDGSDEISEENR